MRRKKRINRPLSPDPLYGNELVAKFINYVMRKGKKELAQRIIYKAFEIIKEKTKKEPLEIFDLAVENASPVLEVKSRRIGGATYQVPIGVRGDRKISLAFRWILNAAKSNKGKTMKEKLAQELMEAANNTGAAIKKKQDVHRMAEANRAFAHFAR